jgi:hypothetical protein
MDLRTNSYFSDYFFLYPRRSVFTARYEVNIFIKLRFLLILKQSADICCDPGLTRNSWRASERLRSLETLWRRPVLRPPNRLIESYSAGTFHLPWQVFFSVIFPQLQCECPSIMRRWDTARIPPQARRLYRNSCPPSRPFGRDYATLVSNQPKHAPHRLKLMKLVRPVVVKPRQKTVSISTTPVTV